MNFQELLTRLSASCFAADRPDYDWKTLRLFPETGLDLALIVRLAASLILCIVGALVHSTVLRYMLLVLSVLAAGYDYLCGCNCLHSQPAGVPARSDRDRVRDRYHGGRTAGGRRCFSARVPGRFDP